jgi:hypothetical protein
VEANQELINKLNSRFLFLEHITMDEGDKASPGMGKKVMNQPGGKKKTKKAAGTVPVNLHHSKTGMCLTPLLLSIFM